MGRCFRKGMHASAAAAGSSASRMRNGSACSPSSRYHCERALVSASKRTARAREWSLGFGGLTSVYSDAQRKKTDFMRPVTMPRISGKLPSVVTRPGSSIAPLPPKPIAVKITCARAQSQNEHRRRALRVQRPLPQRCAARRVAHHAGVARLHNTLVGGEDSQEPRGVQDLRARTQLRRSVAPTSAAGSLGAARRSARRHVRGQTLGRRLSGRAPR